MKKFTVEVSDIMVYEVEAEDVDTAMDIALEWWDERVPNVEVIAEEIED